MILELTHELEDHIAVAILNFSTAHDAAMTSHSFFLRVKNNEAVLDIEANMYKLVSSDCTCSATSGGKKG